MKKRKHRISTVRITLHAETKRIPRGMSINARDEKSPGKEPAVSATRKGWCHSLLWYGIAFWNDKMCAKPTKDCNQMNTAGSKEKGKCAKNSTETAKEDI